MSRNYLLNILSSAIVGYVTYDKWKLNKWQAIMQCRCCCPEVPTRAEFQLGIFNVVKLRSWIKIVNNCMHK